ncbi:unnamed protein product [Miscanthus lutarioriparius]|uniref:Uncharacterized protein n=1 Tax=Miscanthus lutarioriparius TaxID=422564 RepID=A0A811N9S4_9POAL|nr:unnamed protein product [Miscanthus lutarioriparius]
MEPSLAGDPERRQRKPPKSRAHRAFNRIKNKAVVDKLVSKFPAPTFTVMLFHYDGTVEQWGDLEWSDRAVHVAVRGRTKWWFAKRFLHPDVVAENDYAFVWDEDIEVDAFNPIRYLGVVRREGLEVSQPARRRAPRSTTPSRHATIVVDGRRRAPAGVANAWLWTVVTQTGRHFRILRLSRARTCAPARRGFPRAIRRTAPVRPFGPDAFRVQNDLIHGWGLDYRLGYCAQGDRALNVGVVDSEYVLHRGVPILSDGGTATPSAVRL